jgi:hypothetical protein
VTVAGAAGCSAGGERMASVAAAAEVQPSPPIPVSRLKWLTGAHPGTINRDGIGDVANCPLMFSTSRGVDLRSGRGPGAPP